MSLWRAGARGTTPGSVEHLPCAYSNDGADRKDTHRQSQEYPALRPVGLALACGGWRRGGDATERQDVLVKQRVFR